MTEAFHIPPPPPPRSSPQPDYALWSPRCLLWIGCLTSFLFSGVLQAINYGRLGMEQRRRHWIVSCILFFVPLQTLIFLAPSFYLAAMGGIAINTAAAIYIGLKGVPEFRRHEAAGGSRAAAGILLPEAPRRRHPHRRASVALALRWLSAMIGRDLRFVRLFAFLGPRQTVDICRSRGLALLEKFVRSRQKTTDSRQSVGRPRHAGHAVSLSSFFSQKYNPHLFTQPLLTAEPMHPPAHSQTAFVGWCRAAVPTLSGANIDSGAIPVPVFAPGSGNSTTRRRRVV